MEAASKFAKAYGLKAPKIAGHTARGYVFTTNAEEATIMTTTIIDKAEINRELVATWAEDSFVFKGRRIRWAETVKAVLENHGVQLPEDNRHPVSTKVQRFMREHLEA